MYRIPSFSPNPSLGWTKTRIRLPCIQNHLWCCAKTKILNSSTNGVRHNCDFEKNNCNYKIILTDSQRAHCQLSQLANLSNCSWVIWRQFSWYHLWHMVHCIHLVPSSSCSSERWHVLQSSCLDVIFLLLLAARTWKLSRLLNTQTNFSIIMIL